MCVNLLICHWRPKRGTLWLVMSKVVSAITKQRPRGNRAADAVVAVRLELAEQLLAEGCPRPVFRERFREAHPKVDDRTIDRYRQKAWQAIRVRREAERAHDVETRLHRLTYLSHKLEGEQAYAPMMRAEQLLAQITGVLEAEKHLHLHQVAQPAQASAIDWANTPAHIVEAAAALASLLAEQGGTRTLPEHQNAPGGPPANFGGGMEDDE